MKKCTKHFPHDILPEKAKNPLRLFGLLTLIIAACVAGFVIIIYVSMIKGAVNESDYVRIMEGGVPTQIRAIAFEMEKWAVHIAKDPYIKRLAQEGLQALESEGGGKGGPETDIIRHQLSDTIFLKWGMLSQDPRPKEVQILLGPELTSFLWINRPGLYGFTRNDKNTLLSESYNTLLPVSGFET